MDINEIGNSYQSKVRTPHKVSKDNGFKKIFEKKLSEINATPLQTTVEGKTEVLERGDKILGLLEDYTRELNDPAKTLKDIGPLVESIEKEVSLIEAEAADKLSNDRALEQFIRDLAVTANVAVLKFQRGDYI